MPELRLPDLRRHRPARHEYNRRSRAGLEIMQPHTVARIEIAIHGLGLGEHRIGSKAEKNKQRNRAVTCWHKRVYPRSTKSPFQQRKSGITITASPAANPSLSASTRMKPLVSRSGPSMCEPWPLRT